MGGSWPLARSRPARASEREGAGLSVPKSASQSRSSDKSLCCGEEGSSERRERLERHWSSVDSLPRGNVMGGREKSRGPRSQGPGHVDGGSQMGQSWGRRLRPEEPGSWRPCREPLFFKTTFDYLHAHVERQSTQISKEKKTKPLYSHHLVNIAVNTLLSVLLDLSMHRLFFLIKTRS